MTTVTDGLTTDPTPAEETTPRQGTPQHARVVIIGGGFSGIAMAHRLSESRFTDFVVLERSGGVGGVWQANTYPGCTCDVPSHLYSFSFAPNPDWSSTYSPQPEIQEYLHDCIDRFGLRPYLRTGVDVTQARWDEGRQFWELDTTGGPWTAQVLVSAVGPLTEPQLPDVPGLARFAGTVMHSARWDHSYDLTGKTVASIGTGASAIQYVPRIADQVGRLYVFQRSAPWVMPHDKRPITDAERARFRRHPITQQIARGKVYVAKEALILGFVKQPRLMKLVEGLSRKHMESQVADPNLRKQLTPSYTIGCKRIVPSNDWYPALQKPNVTLVPHALREIRDHSVVDSQGVERDVDAIIFGTGYHVTDIPIAVRIRGRGGALLSDVWDGSPRAYLGTSVPGFPNFFMFLGPNTGLGHSSMVYMLEAQVEHITRAIRELDTSDSATIEVNQDAHDRYNERLDSALATTVWEVGGCTSFYRDANGRNATIYPGWTFQFRRQAKRWNPAAYRMSGSRKAAQTAPSTGDVLVSASS